MGNTDCKCRQGAALNVVKLGNSNVAVDADGHGGNAVNVDHPTVDINRPPFSGRPHTDAGGDGLISDTKVEALPLSFVDDQASQPVKVPLEPGLLYHCGVAKYNAPVGFAQAVPSSSSVKAPLEPGLLYHCGHGADVDVRPLSHDEGQTSKKVVRIPPEPGLLYHCGCVQQKEVGHALVQKCSDSRTNSARQGVNDKVFNSLGAIAILAGSAQRPMTLSARCETAEPERITVDDKLAESDALINEQRKPPEFDAWAFPNEIQPTLMLARFRALPIIGGRPVLAEGDDGPLSALARLCRLGNCCAVTRSGESLAGLHLGAAQHAFHETSPVRVPCGSVHGTS